MPMEPADELNAASDLCRRGTASNVNILIANDH